MTGLTSSVAVATPEAVVLAPLSAAVSERESLELSSRYSFVNGDIDKAMTPDTLYPVPFQLNDVFYDPHGRGEGHFTDATLSVHLYTNGTKPWWRKHAPLPGSYAARMCERLGIDPAAALEE